MNQRIRYSKTNSGVLLSRRNFVVANGTEVSVELDLNAKTYRILDAATGAQVASGGNTKNASVLKIQAKRGLTELGAQFGEETRNRGTELTESNVGVG